MPCPLRRGVLPALLIVLSPLATTAAQELKLQDAERIALERDPSLTRLDALADAARHRGVADGALPDPEISIGYQNLPVDDFSTRDDMMTMLMVGARQRFPAGRSRQLTRERGGVESQAIHVEKHNRALEIRREVRNAWLDWRLAHESLVVARDTQQAFAGLADIVQRRVASGSARSRDSSQARLELAALTERIIELEARREAAAAELGRWLDQPVPAQATAGPPPAWPDPPPLAVLVDDLSQHPAVHAAELRAEAGARGVDIARQAYKPMWMVELGYGVRRDNPAAQIERSDMLSGMVSLSVPLFTGNRQDRQLEAAVRDEDAARAERADRLRRLQGQAERSMAMWQRLDELTAFYETELLAESRHLVDTTESAYRSDRATFDELIRARVDEFQQRLRALNVSRERAAARVELLYLQGE